MKPTQHTCTSRQSAFTLIELLVIVSVIAMLAAILIPTISAARQQSRTVVCSSNLRQWGWAMRIYAEQNRDMLPRRGQGAQPTTIINRAEDWFNALPPSLRMKSFNDSILTHSLPRPPMQSLWCCPSQIDTGQPYFWSYGMNMWLSPWIANKADRIDKVGPPATLVAFADGPGPHCSVLPSNQTYSPVAIHKGLVNLCFLDTHVGSFTGKYVGCGTGFTQKANVRWQVPGMPGLDRSRFAIRGEQRMKQSCFTLCGLLTVYTISAARIDAATVILGASQDNTIFQNAFNNSLGGGQAIFAGTNGMSSPRRGLIAFDIAFSVPNGATITGAQLTLYLVQAAGTGMGGGAGNFTIGLYRATSSWGEGTAGSATSGAALVGSGLAAGDGDATWNTRFYSATAPTLWTAPGGDFVATASSSASVGTTVNAAYTWPSTPTLVADVQSWLDSPGGNFGWLLKNDNESSPQTFRAFWSREESRTDPDSLYVPQLQITYTLPAITATQWRSVRTHSGAGELAIVLDPVAGGSGVAGPTVEPRSGGVQRIEVDFSSPVTLTGDPVAGITVRDAANSYIPTSVSQVDGNTIAIYFDSRVLPDQRCYTIAIGLGTVVQALSGDLDCCIRALVGDTTGDGTVNLSDVIFTQMKSAGSPSAASAPRLDVNLSGGAIDLADTLFVKSLVASPARQALCP